MENNNSTIETELLVLAAQEGNVRAMDELVNRWQKQLWLHAWRLSRDTQASWDITQESWLAIIKGINKLRDPAHFKAWSLKITTNKAINWVNKKSSSQEKTNIETIEILQDKKKTDNILDDLLQKIDLKKRTVIALFYYEGMNIKDISKILNIPAGTVKSRLAHARSEIKLLIEKEQNYEYRNIK